MAASASSAASDVTASDRSPPLPETGSHRLALHPDRFFDPDPRLRNIAHALHEETSQLPLVCPHGHVDVGLLARNEPFPEPTALLITPDHYILRMLHSQGVPLERLGVRARDGTVQEGDPRAVWRLFAAHYHLFRGTPSAAWLDYELHELFGVRKRLDAGTAETVYDAVAERLASPEYRPRALFERFRIEALATTDAATDTLEDHAALKESGWKGRVIPTFRPDALFRISSTGWRSELAKLTGAHGPAVVDFQGLLNALAERRAFFRSLGATATDHGVTQPFTEHLPADQAERLFQVARDGVATMEDERRFGAHMLMEMARMSVDDGMVMQLHAGVWRDHNLGLHERFGPNVGGDIPIACDYTTGLHALLNAYGDDPRFRLIVFTLDESTYARELAPLAGHYPAMRLGAPWWFHDSIEGMKRFRERTSETAGICNTAGFNDDTRAFCSIPARHDLSRRVDANWLAGLVVRHVISSSDAREMARALAYDLARDAYRLDPTAS